MLNSIEVKPIFVLTLSCTSSVCFPDIILPNFNIVLIFSRHQACLSQYKNKVVMVTIITIKLTNKRFPGKQKASCYR